MPDLCSRLLRAADAPGEVRVITPDETITQGALTDFAKAAPSESGARGRIGLRLGSAADLVRALVLLDGQAEALALLPGTLTNNQIAELARRRGLTEIIEQVPNIGTQQRSTAAVGTSWIVTSSGTTGAPKAVSHSLASLVRTVRARPADAALPSSTRPAWTTPVWGLLYDPARFAGLQVVLQALLGAGRLVCPDPAAPLGERIAMLAVHGCTHLSATPSLWRRILMAPEARHLALRQITLGGEIAEQALLNSLARAFPDARITHIYASTEVGVGFAVTDGIAGFPARWLDEPAGPNRLRVTGDVLWVQPDSHACDDAIERDADGFIRTGDRVRCVNGRVMFLGREGTSINIGGIKVQPEAVEAVLRSHPGVAECRISARPSAVMGALLVAEIVPASGSPEDLRVQIKRWCKDKLPREAQPAMITLRADLPTTAAGKLVRQGTEEAA